MSHEKKSPDAGPCQKCGQWLIDPSLYEDGLCEPCKGVTETKAEEKEEIEEALAGESAEQATERRRKATKKSKR